MIERLTESSRDSNDETRTRAKLSCKVDFLVWRSLNELNAWDGISDFDHDCDCLIAG